MNDENEASGSVGDVNTRATGGYLINVQLQHIYDASVFYGFNEFLHARLISMLRYTQYIYIYIYEGKVLLRHNRSPQRYTMNAI